MDVFNDNSLKMVQKLQEQESDEEFNINPYVTLCALDIICETAMGVNINAQDGGSADFVQATREMGEAITKRTFQPWLQPDLIFCLSDNGRRQKKSIGILHEMTDKIIKQRKEELADQEKRDMEDQLKQSEDDDDDLCIKKRRAFLDMMLEASKYDEVMSIAELREEVHTFMFEGHDMTTSGISFILSSLSHNQDIQDRVVEELESIFGDSDRDATYRDIQEMKYLELVVKESQRMFPSLPMYVRNIKEDIEMDGYTLPKGANVSIVNILMHRDANFFPDPEKFDPERFTPENCHGRNPYQPEIRHARDEDGSVQSAEELQASTREYDQQDGGTGLQSGAKKREWCKSYQGRLVTWGTNLNVFSEFDISSDSTVLLCQAHGKYLLQTSKQLLSAQPYHPSVTSSVLFTSRICSERLCNRVKRVFMLEHVSRFGSRWHYGGFEDFLHALVRLRAQYGPIIRLWLGPELFVFITDPKYVEPNYLGQEGGFTSTLPWIRSCVGTKWRTHRKIITPTFHFSILEDFLDIFNANGRKLVEKLQKEVNGPEFDLYPYVTLCALDIICGEKYDNKDETAMGIKINAQDGGSADFVEATRGLSPSTLGSLWLVLSSPSSDTSEDQVSKDSSWQKERSETPVRMADVVVKRSFQPWLHSNIIFWLSATGRLQRKSLAVLHGMSDKVIKSKKAEFIEAKKSEKKNESREKQEDDFGVKKRRAFLDMLLETVQDGDLLTDDELREEVDTFMFEGHDTTSSGISFALSSLALNQDVQDKAAEELKTIFGDSNRDATFRDIQEMKYLEMVIKEAQRLLPSVPMYVRNLNDDVKVDGYTLPKGANVTIVNIIMHRDASLFPDPEKFDPERFSPENSQGRHPYQYVPFSAGPRNCVGQKFAMLEMKTEVSKVLRSYKLLPGSTTNKMEELVSELVLKNENGIRIRIVPRV
uniref:Cytochrome P450 n=1 Tax=Timema poppense TaxID=170557 RepID=A0A7R9H2Q3_TIMPO|nr:unnamed protein product [Timema poppensis]